MLTRVKNCHSKRSIALSMIARVMMWHGAMYLEKTLSRRKPSGYQRLSYASVACHEVMLPRNARQTSDVTSKWFQVGR